MSARLLVYFIRGILSLRYKVVIKNSVPNLPTKSVLILPNHQALLDPVLLIAVLYPKFQPRPLGDENRLKLRGFASAITAFRPIAIPDMDKNSEKRDQVFVALDEVVKVLKNGENALVYPAGRVYRENKENLRANSAVEYLLKSAPDANVLLVRMNGFWGSDFSWANGVAPSFFGNVFKRVLGVLANGIFFGPRRTITIEFSELPKDFPRQADKLTINRALEAFYNAEKVENTYVPYVWWQGYQPKILPEVLAQEAKADLSQVPAPVIGKIKAKLTEVTGNKNPQLTDRLSVDLGMDSLAIADLMSWVGDEFQNRIENLEEVQKVSDVVLIACGQSTKNETSKKPVPQSWFDSVPKTKLELTSGKTITEVFLNHAYRAPNRVILTDEIGGTKTFRQMLIAIDLLSQKIKLLQGKRVGILLPASATTTIVYTATLMASKVPVMVNWTVGAGVLKSSLDSVEVTNILTSKKMLEKLKSTGVDLASLPYTWVYLEDLAQTISTPSKLISLISTYLPWRTLKAPQNTDPAVILFTSGSEAKPKAVPLSHTNLLQNVYDALTSAKVIREEKLLGMLPPFHSLGLLTGVLLPITVSIPVVYHANPTESVILADIIERYKPTLLLGTPTFIYGILRVADKKQLESIRLIVVGAEKCPDYVYAKMQELCPKGIIVEGYGITECSPVVCLNDPDSPVLGSLGKVFDSLEYTIVHPETYTALPKGEAGLLLVRGPSIFSGYLNHTGSNPFLKYEGKEWYNTGDLVRFDSRGVLFFCGRLKRFVKIAGEMISLVAIEDVLSSHFPADDDGPMVAVEAASADSNPELVLFSRIELEREKINALIREGGLSGLHNIKRVERINLIPVLGTGKTDYKSLRAQLQI